MPLLRWRIRSVTVYAVTAALCFIATSTVAQEHSGTRCSIVEAPDIAAAADSAASEAVREIYTLLDRWREAVREGDIQAVINLVTEDAEFWSHGAASVTGRAALAEAFRPFFTNYELLQEFECHELVVRGDLAFMRGLEINRLVPRAGGDTVEVQQRAFSVMRRSADGRWRFARGMTNQPPGQ
jgi:uncharacterized protein (TIGR02246 family)